jgi:hypothetical protein
VFIVHAIREEVSISKLYDRFKAMNTVNYSLKIKVVVGEVTEPCGRWLVEAIGNALTLPW